MPSKHGILWPARSDTCILPIRTKAPVGLPCMHRLRLCCCHDRIHLFLDVPKLYQVCEDFNCSSLKDHICSREA